MTVVIVGAGLAGANVAMELREQGYGSDIVLFGDEEHAPYERPPLSKGYLMGNDPLDQAFVQERDWYPAHGIDLRTGVEVTAVDPAARTVTTADGVQAYDDLVLATGAAPRRLAIADGSGRPVSYLRTIEDSDRLKAAFAGDGEIAVVGGGWIGLEAAAAARTVDCPVTVYEAAPHVLAVLGPQVAEVFEKLHRAHGVDLRLDTQVTAQDLAGAAQVVVGIGVRPRLDLAESAGLAVDDGILVDAHLRSSDPHIYAVGDIASVDHPVLGARVRVEHWDTAIQQGKTAARNIAGKDEAYQTLPYFFTDQYDLGMEYVGWAKGYDDVRITGDPDALNFRAYWLRDGVVVAAMHVNDWDAIDELRASIGKPLPA